MNKVVDYIEKSFTYIAAAALFVMMTWISVDALGRYLLSRPITGTLEVTEEYLMIIIIFLALGYSWTEGALVKVELFIRRIPRDIRNWIEIIFNLVALILFGIIAVQACRESISCWKEDVFSSGPLAYPLAPAYFLVTVGSVLLGVRLMQRIAILLAVHKPSAKSSRVEDGVHTE